MHNSGVGTADRFATLLGVEYLARSFEVASCRLAVRDQHHNALGGIHGGLIFSLADVAFAAACNAGSSAYIGLQADVRYMRRAQGPELTATATLVSASNTFAHYQVLVTDSFDTPVAQFSGTAYRLSY